MNKAEIDRLLRKIALGDNDAFEKLYEETKRGVFAFLHTYLQNYEDAEDGMQTVYLKIKTGISSYRWGTNGSAWILQIAKNFALNELKKKKQTLPLEETLTAAEHTAEEYGVTAIMEKVLNEEERRIITLHVLWGYKHREIGKILDCPTGTVTSKYKRAIEKLRNALKEVEA